MTAFSCRFRLRPPICRSSSRWQRRLKNLDGIVVTIPHKFACYQACASATERAHFLRTVNLMRRRADGSWHGDMVDGLGFVGAARAKGIDPRGMRALLVGAGGAGSAIALALGRGRRERARDSRQRDRAPRRADRPAQRARQGARAGRHRRSRRLRLRRQCHARRDEGRRPAAGRCHAARTVGLLRLRHHQARDIAVHRGGPQDSAASPRPAPTCTSSTRASWWISCSGPTADAEPLIHVKRIACIDCIGRGLSDARLT